MKLLVYREGAEKVETGFTADQLPELLKEEKTVPMLVLFGASRADQQRKEKIGNK
jgi:hypothetical protein